MDQLCRITGDTPAADLGRRLRIWYVPRRFETKTSEITGLAEKAGIKYRLMYYLLHYAPFRLLRDFAAFSLYLKEAISIQPFDFAHGPCLSAPRPCSGTSSLGFGEKKILLNPPFQKKDGRERRLQLF